MTFAGQDCARSDRHFFHAKLYAMMYRDLAATLGFLEPRVKRKFAKRRLMADRLVLACNLLGSKLAELMQEAP